jgi:muconate cycloisomerase
LGGEIGGLGEWIQRLDEWRLPQAPVSQRECFGNAFRCGVELAALDAATRSMGLPLSAVFDVIREADGLRQTVERVQYSAAITSTSLLKALFAAAMYRYYEFRFCKVKVGARQSGDGRLLGGIRRVMGSKADLRVDVNEAWKPEEVEKQTEQLRGARPSAIEQPVRHKDVGVLGAIRRRLGVPIVLDESLCSEADARRVIDEGLCDIFNLRLSKCGGMIRCVQLARMAAQAGLACQLGCQVGETGILSAAGRHFASSIKGLRYVEGSFDRLVVAEPLITEDITFRRGGWAVRLTGPGLGVEIDEDAVERVMVRNITRQPN